MFPDLSAIDLKILDLMQHDSSLSTNELAERVGLSQSPCWRRLQKLREDGYIRSEVALLDRGKLEGHFFIFATLRVSTLPADQRSTFIRKIELIPEIMECYSIFGDRDLLIKVIAPSMEWYQNFVFKTIMNLPGVIDVNSTIAMGEFKYTTAIPVRGSRAL